MLGEEIRLNECCKHYDIIKRYFNTDNYCPDCGEPLDIKSALKKYSMLAQLWFLYERLKLQISASLQTNICAMERSVYDDRFVFAQMIYDEGNMPEIDFNTYLGHYTNILTALKLGNISEPKKVVFITANYKLQLQRIEKRIELENRDFEKFYLTPEGNKYLQKLNEYYLKMYESWQGDKILIENNGDLELPIKSIIEFYNR